jgi:flagellar biosynthesis activator protein FlaF
VYPNNQTDELLHGKDSMGGRETESAVLIRAAHGLKECQDNWNAADCHAKLDTAVKFNQLIWNIFQGELDKASNPMSPELRGNMLRLADFVNKRLLEIEADPDPEKLTVVININNNIAAGLMDN